MRSPTETLSWRLPTQIQHHKRLQAFISCWKGSNNWYRHRHRLAVNGGDVNRWWRLAAETVTSLSRRRVTVWCYLIFFIPLEKLAPKWENLHFCVESKDGENELVDKLFRFFGIHFWQKHWWKSHRMHRGFYFCNTFFGTISMARWVCFLAKGPLVKLWTKKLLWLIYGGILFMYSLCYKKGT